MAYLQAWHETETGSKHGAYKTKSEYVQFSSLSDKILLGSEETFAPCS